MSLPTETCTGFAAAGSHFRWRGYPKRGESGLMKRTQRAVYIQYLSLARKGGVLLISRSVGARPPLRRARAPSTKNKNIC